MRLVSVVTNVRSPRSIRSRISDKRSSTCPLEARISTIGSRIPVGRIISSVTIDEELANPGSLRAEARQDEDCCISQSPGVAETKMHCCTRAQNSASCKGRLSRADGSRKPDVCSVYMCDLRCEHNVDAYLDFELCSTTPGTNPSSRKQASLSAVFWLPEGTPLLTGVLGKQTKIDALWGTHRVEPMSPCAFCPQNTYHEFAAQKYVTHLRSITNRLGENSPRGNQVDRQPEAHKTPSVHGCARVCATDGGASGACKNVRKYKRTRQESNTSCLPPDMPDDVHSSPPAKG